MKEDNKKKKERGWFVNFNAGDNEKSVANFNKNMQAGEAMNESVDLRCISKEQLFSVCDKVNALEDVLNTFSYKQKKDFYVLEDIEKWVQGFWIDLFNMFDTTGYENNKEILSRIPEYKDELFKRYDLRSDMYECLSTANKLNEDTAFDFTNKLSNPAYIVLLVYYSDKEFGEHYTCKVFEFSDDDSCTSFCDKIASGGDKDAIALLSMYQDEATGDYHFEGHMNLNGATVDANDMMNIAHEFVHKLSFKESWTKDDPKWNVLDSLVNDIENIKYNLSKQKPCENFGQDEVRKLRDKYSSYIYDPVVGSQVEKWLRHIDDWCSTYTGAPVNESWWNESKKILSNIKSMSDELERLRHSLVYDYDDKADEELFNSSTWDSFHTAVVNRLEELDAILDKMSVHYSNEAKARFQEADEIIAIWNKWASIYKEAIENGCDIDSSKIAAGKEILNIPNISNMITECVKLDEASERNFNKRPSVDETLDLIIDYFKEIGLSDGLGYDDEVDSNCYKWYLPKSLRPVAMLRLGQGFVDKLKRDFGFGDNDFYISKKTNSYQIDAYRGDWPVLQVYFNRNLNPEDEDPYITATIYECE